MCTLLYAIALWSAADVRAAEVEYHFAYKKKRGSGFIQLESDKGKGACADRILGRNTKCIDEGELPAFHSPAPAPCVTRTDQPNDPLNCKSGQNFRPSPPPKTVDRRYPIRY